MERLTLVIPNGDIWLLDSTGTPCTLVTEDDDTYKYVKRLAEYEDIGLLPEQIIEVDKLYAEKCKELAELQKSCSSSLKLPCKVGDTVYTNISIQGWYFRKENRPYKAKVVFIGINGVDNFINVDFGNGRMLRFNFSDIGKKVFLTQEKAEAALQKMNETEKKE